MKECAKNKKKDDQELNYQTPKLDKIYDFLKLKALAKSEKDNIKKYIEVNNKIKNGKAVVRGTRITTREIVFMLVESKNEKNAFEHLREQYPSIENDEQIYYAILYEIDRMSKLRYAIKVRII